MRAEQSFLKTVCRIAIPVAFQSMLQSSFSIVDQIMIGQLGSVNVAGVGLAGKFSSIYSVITAAVGTVAGIMISQYVGQCNKREVRRSFYLNLLLALGIAAAFTLLCIGFPEQIMRIYTEDEEMVLVSAKYLKIIAWSFFPAAGATLFSAMYRCIDQALLPLYSGIAAAVLNTGLNYCLLFGKSGFPAMGVRGAAIATLISQLVNFSILFVCLHKGGAYLKKAPDEAISCRFLWKQYMQMLLPILFCEFMWSLGENVYAAIYGHIGSTATAAMTLLNPIQGLMTGALCGLSQAAGVIIGKRLGSREYDDAYDASKKLILYGFVCSVLLSLAILITRTRYTEIYRVEPAVRDETGRILIAYAFVAPFKVQNMIVGGGILRSGGKTKYVMLIDLIGTWVFGVPLGLFSAFGLKLSVPWVYFILSLEECVRFGISLVVLRRRKWMQCLDAAQV